MTSPIIEAQAKRHFEGYVPNQETAIRIAEAVLTAVYGTEAVNREKPFTALLSNGIWYVSGTAPGTTRGQTLGGGAAEIQIAKPDGRILLVTRAK